MPPAPPLPSPLPPGVKREGSRNHYWERGQEKMEGAFARCSTMVSQAKAEKIRETLMAKLGTIQDDDAGEEGEEEEEEGPVGA